MAAVALDSFIEVLQLRCLEDAGSYVQTALSEGKSEQITYLELASRARSLGALLQRLGLGGERALLLYPTGVGFTSAFFGCLYGGVVAVPVPPPEPGRLKRTLARLVSIVEDAQPAVALTTSSLLAHLDELKREAPLLSSMRWMATDGLPAGLSDEWRDPGAGRDTLAYLQYTSGSTSLPKGVMVSHGNLLRNSEHIRQAWGYTRESRAVMWVPNFHDDGLVHGILQPVYTGFRSYLMPPADFIRQPGNWLRAISRLRATHSGGPNFAYALCVRKVAPDERQDLDLRSWRVAYNAAEPVRSETLEQFTEAFGPCGFSRDAFHPSFGLAEATLLVTTPESTAPPALCPVDADALEQGRILAPSGQARTRLLVGCGKPVGGTRVEIVHPETSVRCAAGEVGEIWIADPSVAQGYWRRPEETERTFGARLADSGEGPFLRTGDLGFLRQGELFITGRRKDLIILRGRNLYPQDIELTAERCHPALRSGCGAAFSVEAAGEERLVVIQEVDTRSPFDPGEIADLVSRALADEHDAQLYSLVLVAPGTIAKTSSGKIQRHACRAELLAGALQTVASWRLPLAAEAGKGPADGAERLNEWLRAYARERINSRLIDERRSIPPSVVLDFGRQGLLGLQAPVRSGGLGLSTAGMMKVLEQLGAIDLTLATFVAGHNALGLRPVERFATAPRREELLAELASGRQLAAFALTEPGAGSNPRALAATATEIGPERWRLRGTKLWSGSASWAGVVNVFARLVTADGRLGGITAFQVRQGTPGLRLGPEALTMGLRGMSQSAIHLEDAEVGRDDLLGEPGAGMAVAEDAMTFTRLCLAAIAVGGMKRCARMMVRYASRRQIATGRLLDNPVTLVRLGELTAAIQALECLVQVVAAALDQGRRVPSELFAACKTAGPELLWQAADDLVQLLGGRGYLENNAAPQILRDARVFRIFEGPTEALRMHLGSSISHGSADLEEFLSGLGAAGAVERLHEAARALGSRLTGPASPFADHSSGLRWAHALTGEAATWALLEAAVGSVAGQSDVNGSEPAALRRAGAWARLRFDEVLRRGLSASPSEAALLSASEIERAVEALTAVVGDVDQAAAGEDGGLDEILRPESVRSAAPVSSPLAPSVPARPARMEGSAVRAGRTAGAIRGWVTEWLVREVGLDARAIDPRRPFASHGLDSVTGVRLADALSQWLGVPLDTTLAWDYPTIDSLALHLSGEPGEPGGAGAPEAPSGEDDLDMILRELDQLSDEEARRLRTRPETTVPRSDV
jgi:acyl-CoA synthetase (AMP-forming)/AMP-acid ligase II/alkylation response protein AidB-like acyl-CoA dehydrogenase/acyl carrier protein